jgi:fused signal recognition particle receptor
MIAAGVQFGLLSIALLIEFSDRKRRPRLVAQTVRPRAAVAAGPAPSRRPASVTRVSGPPKAEPQAPPPVEPAPPAVEAEPPPSEPSTVGGISAPETAAIPEEIAEQAPPQPAIVVAPSAAAEIGEPTSAPVPTAEVQPSATGEPPPAVEQLRPSAEVAEPPRIGLGLRKTREGFLSRIRAAITGSAKIDEIYEGLEEALIAADVGVEASMKIVAAVRASLKNDSRPDAIRAALKSEIERILMAAARPVADPGGDEPLVIMLAGVNGAGKTTTVAKLAAMFKAQRGPVTVAAADTFRAAAIEQLEVWCNRVGADIIKQKQGSDPAAVAFDAVKSARARKASTVLIDTAGRLQTKVNLMEELKKIGRVVGRELPGAPHEAWLVLDATTGQNALSQARQFGEVLALTGVVLAKLDSSAKGGVIIAISEQLKLPVRYVGLGEKVEDLRPFDPREFVEALFENDESRSGTTGSYAA